MTTDHNDLVNGLIDNKGPFKGKGVDAESFAAAATLWRRDASQRLAQIRRQMQALAAESKTIAGRRFALAVYALKAARQLRWRMTGGAHTTWARVEPLLASLSWALANWYRQAQGLVVWLNHRERAARFELRQAHLLALQMPVGRRHVPGADPQST